MNVVVHGLKPDSSFYPDKYQVTNECRCSRIETFSSDFPPGNFVRLQMNVVVHGLKQ